MKKVTIALLSLGISLQAGVIKEIDFKNLNYLSKESAIDIMRLKIGSNYDENSINEAVKRLYAQGYFSQIAVYEENNILRFLVKEKESIAKINFEGIATNDEKVLKEVLGIKQGSLYDEAVLNAAVNNVKMFYEAKGFYDTVVESKVIKLKKSIEIVFMINRGENIIIEKVNLIGAKHFDYSDIEPLVQNKSKEIFGSWMWGLNDGKLKALALPQDTARVKDKYLEAGYLDVRVSPAFVRADMDTYKAYLSYFISEGEPYKISDIVLDIDFFSPKEKKELLEKIGSRRHKIADALILRKDLEIIKLKFQDKGYAYANIIPNVQKNASEHTISVTFHDQKGKLVRIGNINISGNTNTEDRVIRRNMQITEGYLYNKTDIIESKNALRRTGYFKSVNIEEIPMGPEKIDLLVKVEEKKTGSITGGIGYGSMDGVVLTAAVAEKNIFGTGISGNVSIEREEEGISGSISLVNPRFDDSEYSLSGSIYSNRFDWDSYHERNYGFKAAVGRWINDYTQVGVSYNLEFSDINELSESMILSGYRKGKSTKSSITPGINFNNTDDYYLPRSGYIANASLEWAGLGGDQKFIAFLTDVSWFKGLKQYLGHDIIFRAHGSFAKEFDNGYLPVNEKIYLGGVDSIRGFDKRSLSPKNIFGDELGGEIALTSSATLSFPLLDRIKLRANVFFDYAMIGKDNLSEIVRYSTGLALEWNSPFGSMQLIYAQPFNTGPQDNIRRFEFNMGSSF